MPHTHARAAVLLPTHQASRSSPHILSSLPQVRYNTLSSGKTLLTPQPRLRTGFFSSLHRDHIPPEALLEACTSAGVQK